MKRMIVLISGPYQFLQALWYCTEHPEYEYVALLKLHQQTPESVTRTLELCKKSELFHDYIEYNLTGFDSSFLKMAVLGIKMTCYFAAGQRKRLAKKLIRAQLGDLDYDAVLIDSDYSVLSGCFITCSDEKEVIIMQEGSSDIIARRDYPRMNLKHILGFIFARMGFANFAADYKLRDTYRCYKLMSRPDLAVYKDYKEIMTLFAPGNNHDVFLQQLNRLYSTVDWQVINSVDYVLFTSPIGLFFKDYSVYDQMREWMNTFAAGKKILIKKHPRDDYDYDWNEFDISFIDEAIPAEVFLSQITKPHIIHMYLSTIMMNMPETQTNYTLLYFNSVKAERYRNGFYELLDSLGIQKNHVKYLG